MGNKAKWRFSVLLYSSRRFKHQMNYLEAEIRAAQEVKHRGIILHILKNKAYQTINTFSDTNKASRDVFLKHLQLATTQM